ncbi:hypothetical protein [Streptomyces coffeae]|uniref:hypothetical protein n=1 Tax=Streptomyces coffeae TaxID=621382 RepID=UPI0027DB384B|nr:hypothetical protein [Streptomyces coffeae]
MPDRAPYDAVIVSAAFPEVPAPLTGELGSGGRLVQPVGPGGQDQVVSLLRTAAGLKRRRILTPAYFVSSACEDATASPAEPCRPRRTAGVPAAGFHPQ